MSIEYDQISTSIPLEIKSINKPFSMLWPQQSVKISIEPATENSNNCSRTNLLANTRNDFFSESNFEKDKGNNFIHERGGNPIQAQLSESYSQFSRYQAGISFRVIPQTTYSNPFDQLVRRTRFPNQKVSLRIV